MVPAISEAQAFEHFDPERCLAGLLPLPQSAEVGSEAIPSLQHDRETLSFAQIIFDRRPLLAQSSQFLFAVRDVAFEHVSLRKQGREVYPKLGGLLVVLGLKRLFLLEFDERRPDRVAGRGDDGNAQDALDRHPDLRAHVRVGI